MGFCTRGCIFLGAFGRAGQWTPNPEGLYTIEFFFPNSRALCLLFLQIAQMGLILPRRGHFAQKTTSNPCSLLSSHTPLSGIRTYTKHSNPTPKHLFPGLILKVGKLTTVWAKRLKSGQNISRSGQKNLLVFMISNNFYHLTLKPGAFPSW